MQNKRPALFKNVKLTKDDEKNEKLFQVEGTERDRATNAACDNGLNEPCTEKLPPPLFFTRGMGRDKGGGATPKDIIRSTDKILIRSYISVHFLILSIVLW